MAKQAYFLASAGKTEEAFQVALQLKEWAPAHPEAEYVLSRAIFLDRTLAPHQKDSLITEHGLRGPWTSYFRAILWAGQGQPEQALTLITEALRKPEAFKDELPLVVAEATLLCRTAAGVDCDGLAERYRGLPEWSEARFQGRMKRQ